MPQKIYDIIPIKKEIYREKEESVEEKKPKREISKGFKKYVPYFFVAVFVFIGVWAYFSFSVAEIEIWIEKERINLEDIIIINPNVEHNYINVIEGIVYGKLFSETRSEKQNFLATGKTIAEKRAQGIIRVYNNHSTENQVIVPQTRFVSTDGKLFRSVNRETIPGGRYVGGKLEPGYVDIEVVAAEAGEEYNIGPTNFSIPGFVGTAKYVDFYGKSSLPMTRGFKGESSIILKEDIDRAKIILQEKILRDIYYSIISIAEKEDFLILGEEFLLKKEILKENLSFKEGDIVSDFDYEIEIYTEFLGFKKMAIEAIARSLIDLNIDDNKKVKENSINIEYELLEINNQGEVVVKTAYQAEIYSEINLIEIEKKILGQEREEIKNILLNIYGIEKVQINSWPLFRSKIPSNTEKIKIKLNI